MSQITEQNAQIARMYPSSVSTGVVSSYNSPFSGGYSQPASSYYTPTPSYSAPVAAQAQSTPSSLAATNYTQSPSNYFSNPSTNSAAAQVAAMSAAQMQRIQNPVQAQSAPVAQPAASSAPTSYAQTYNPNATPGRGYDANLSPPTPVSRMPGGAGIDASGNRVPYWGPYGETEKQAMTGIDPGTTGPTRARDIANSLVSASRGMGVGTGGWNPGYSTLQDWLSNPAVQQALPYDYTPPQGYQDWLSQQSSSKAATSAADLGYNTSEATKGKKWDPANQAWYSDSTGGRVYE